MEFKPRVLTERDRKRIDNMNENLFPDKDFSKWGGDLNNYIIIGDKESGLYKTKIHWFEYCITVLAEKLSENSIINMKISPNIKKSTNIITFLFEIYLFEDKRHKRD